MARQLTAIKVPNHELDRQVHTRN